MKTFLLVLLLFIAQLPSAQPRNFDITADKLSPGFAGLDIKAIYQDLKGKAQIEKGEFETTAQFQLRVNQQESALILGSLDRTKLFAFAIQNSSGETTYDADRQIMTIALVLKSASKDIYTRSEKRAFTGRFDLKSDTYEASNAHGAKVTVTRHSGESFDFAFSNYSEFGLVSYVKSLTKRLGFDRADEALVLTVPMDLQTAKALKENIKALAVVRLVQPYTYEGIFYDKATFTKPQESFVRYHYLNTEIVELWAYDKVSGRVLQKNRAN